ncbi:hypothetical protein GEMRC1_004348 [Eukaryota sp. GEM-RC1]
MTSFGKLGVSLIRGLQGTPSHTLPKFDDPSLRTIATEINSINPILTQQVADVDHHRSTGEAVPPVLISKVLSNYAVVERNKRLGLVYLMERCKRLQNLCKKTSGTITPEVKSNLIGDEEVFLLRYNELLTTVSMAYGSNIFASSPPVHPYVKVEAVKDAGQIVLPSGNHVELGIGMIHELQRSDAEQLISMGIVTVLD